MVPFHISTVGTVGASSGSPVTVPGIVTGDVLLSIVKWKATTRATPVAVATFVVSDGAIESASVDTSTYYLEVRWTAG